MSHLASLSRAAPAGPGGPGAGAALGRPRERGHRALVVLGVIVLVLVVGAGVVGWRAFHHHQATGGTSAADTVVSPVVAAAGPASTGPLPAGYSRYAESAATAGSTAGFTIAVPNTWNPSVKGASTFFYAPGGNPYLEVDLTPHTYTNMLVEARWLSALTLKQGRFPGYRGLGIRPVSIRGMSAAAWEFTWENPSVGRMRVLDLMFIANTSAGRQSYALYMTAPEASWNHYLPAFDEEMRTFKPQS